MVNEITELFTITGAAAGIGVKYDITFSGKSLYLCREPITIVSERSPVNL